MAKKFHYKVQAGPVEHESEIAFKYCTNLAEVGTFIEGLDSRYTMADVHYVGGLPKAEYYRTESGWTTLRRGQA